MRAVNVYIQGGKSIGEALGDKTLSGQVITFIEFIADHNLKDARITFDTRGMERNFIKQMLDACKSVFRCFQGDTANQSVNFITFFK